MGFKEKYGWNRYIGAVIRDTQKISPRFRRNMVRLGKSLKALLVHRFNLWDYLPEIDQMRKDGNVYSFSKNGKRIKLYLPAYEHDFIQRNIVTYGDFYEADELKMIGNEVEISGSVILDIGANIGNHTVYWGKIGEAAQIHSFEPVPETFEILDRNIALNDLQNVVTLYHVALGKEPGKADIKLWDPNNYGKTQITASEGGSMQLARLDDYSFDRIDFIKIDVETFEYNLLLGARKTLTKHSPKIFIEIFQEHFEKVNRLLEEYGYRKLKELSLYNYIYVKNTTD